MISKSGQQDRNCVQVPGTEVGCWLSNKRINFSHVTRNVEGGSPSMYSSSPTCSQGLRFLLLLFSPPSLAVKVCPLVFKMPASGQEEGEMVKGKRRNQASCHLFKRFLESTCLIGPNGVMGPPLATKKAGRILTEHSACPGKEASSGKRKMESVYWEAA